jgi:hypothetical protein
MVRPMRRRPPRETSSRRSVGPDSVVASCASDQRVSVRDTRIQSTKYPTVRSRKNGTFR